MKIEKPNQLPSERRLLSDRFTLHILPIKALEENTIANKDTAALIACSSRPVRLERALFSENFCALTFADVTDPAMPNAIQEGHAALIRDYVLGLGEGKTDLYICCDSGESRSPAIAAALLTAAGLPDEVIWRNPFYSPNILVYRRICAAFGITIPDRVLAAKKSSSENAYVEAQKQRSGGRYSRWQVIDMQ